MSPFFDPSYTTKKLVREQVWDLDLLWHHEKSTTARSLGSNHLRGGSDFPVSICARRGRWWIRSSPNRTDPAQNSGIQARRSLLKKIPRMLVVES